jgi:hypothetical protein
MRLYEKLRVCAWNPLPRGKKLFKNLLNSIQNSLSHKKKKLLDFKYFKTDNGSQGSNDGP